MPIEIIPLSYRGYQIFAGVDMITGLTHGPFSQFIIWISLGKSIRKANTRGRRAASLTVREYAYRLKRWFDFIDDWNTDADNADKIEWHTAQKKHMDYFSDQLTKSAISVEPSTRNGLRLVWEMFYEEFCPFMGYSHHMFGLSELVEISPFRLPQTGHFQNNSRQDGNVKRRSLGKDPENESKTFKVLNPEEISFLLAAFDDEVFSCFSYFMYATGLRIGGALQVPYPNTDDVNNQYITSPLLIVRDYDITDGFFPFKYIPKGHEQIGDRYKCDVPLYAWDDIWSVFFPLLETRLQLWRSYMIHTSGDTSYSERYPKTFWLNKKGYEIKATDVWKAFRDACVKIKKNHKHGFPTIVPQMLRHSYATWMIIDFSKKGNVDLDPDNKASVEFIHQYLQDQLGHQHRSTTIKYMRTALRVVKRCWIPKVRLSSNNTTQEDNQANTYDNVVDFKGLMKNLMKELKEDC